MDHPIEPSILAAIDQGRGQRGKTHPQAWSRHRAQVLTAAWHRMTSVRICGAFGLSQTRVLVLLAEGCDAVLRGGAVSVAAESVCTPRWRGWCQNGDTVACDRLQRR